MKRKIRGIIDPYTLGFLISIVGTALAFGLHGDDKNEPTASAIQIESTKVVVTEPADRDAID